METLFCGFSQMDISPANPKDIFLDGFGSRSLPAQEIHDPVYAKVCVLGQGDEEFAVISLDICGLRSPVLERLEMWIGLLTGLDRSRFALCATHTHSGPACGLLQDLPVNMIYWNQVALQICDAIAEARQNSVPGTFRACFAEDFSGGYNRRNKPDIDRRHRVCGFFDEAGGLRGVFTNLACHAVCMGSYGLSADYPGMLTRRAIEAYPGVPFIFLQGRCADIDPLYWEEEGVDKLGNELSDHVFAALDLLKAQEAALGGDIRSVFRNVTIPMYWPPMCELLADLDQQLAKLAAKRNKPQSRRAPEINIRWLQMAIGEQSSGNTDPSITVQMQVLAIGKALWMVFVPFEMFTVTGNAIEANLCAMGIDPAYCYIIGCANGTNGYLAPSAEVDDNTYETRGASRTYMMPQFCYESERTVISQLTELASSLQKT